MANHKRRRPKYQRMGCDCKEWKDKRGRSRDSLRRPSEKRKLQEAV